MKIAFHVHRLGLAGAERQLYYLVSGLASRGHEIHILTLSTGGHLEAEFQKHPNVHVRSFGRYGKFDFRCIYRLCRYIHAENIDLIQGWMRPCNTFSVIAAALTRRPVFMCIRQSTTASLSGADFYIRLDRLLTKCLRVNVVYNSYSGLENHRAIGYSQARDQVIPNGIDSSKVGPVQQPFSQYSPHRLGMLARIEPEKGHDDVIKSLFYLKDTLPSLELHIFGEGDIDLINRLKGLAAKLGVSKQIVWRGISTDCWSALNEIDVLVSASHTEGMSNTIMEGMLAARPILATDVGDTRRMLTESGEELAIIVPAKCPEELANGIRKLLQGPADAMQLALKAELRCKGRYGIAPMVSRYENLYKKSVD